MTYILCISREGEIIVQLGVSAEEALAIVGRAIPKTADVAQVQPDVPQRRGPKPGKKGKRGPYGKKLDSAVMQDAARRHPMTAEIERMLIEGKAVAEIAEACEASKPTVYVIKTRLRQEGRLLE
jgi:DNA-binding CsgD family transcriptional regulator